MPLCMKPMCHNKFWKDRWTNLERFLIFFNKKFLGNEDNKDRFWKKVVCESARGLFCLNFLSVFVKYPYTLRKKGCKTKDINTIHIVCII
jgi:hypothetical protein